MIRCGQIIHLRPECESEYIRHHRRVWPSVLRTVADCNIRNYSIFLRNGLLFAYFEYHGENYDADMQRMTECPHTQAWWKIMDPMQKRVDGTVPSEKWAPLREVFHFDTDEPAAIWGDELSETVSVS